MSLRPVRQTGTALGSGRRLAYLSSLTAAVAGIFLRRAAYLLAHPAKLFSWGKKELGRYV